MQKYVFAALGLAAASIALGLYNLRPAIPIEPVMPPVLQCVEASSSSSFGCKDAGNFDSTCATAKCPAGFTLTGGGGACAAGDRKIKSLFPVSAKGEFTIACEQQGTAPQARAICCAIQ